MASIKSALAKARKVIRELENDKSVSKNTFVITDDESNHQEGGVTVVLFTESEDN